MAGTTTNNGWDYPSSTDLVKDGAVNIQTLAQDIDTSIGTGLLAWQTWAPTLSAGWANGNGVWTAKYVKIGKTVIAMGYFAVGSTTTKGTTLAVSLPVTSANAATINGTAWCGTTNSSGLSNLAVFPTGTASFNLYSQNTAGTYVSWSNVTSTAPITWATNSILSFTVIYEAI